MIDLKEWDKIEFRKIEPGDDILMVRENKHRIFTYMGKVLDWDHNHNWWDVTGNWYASPDHGETMTTTFYKKKFVLPKTPLAIIEGTPRHTSGSPRRYIRLEGGDWCSTSSGHAAFENALLANFKDWKIIFEGITDGDS